MYNKALNIDENCDLSYYNLGIIFRDYYKNYEKSEEYFLKSIKI